MQTAGKDGDQERAHASDPGTGPRLMADRMPGRTRQGPVHEPKILSSSSPACAEVTA